MLFVAAQEEISLKNEGKAFGHHAAKRVASKGQTWPRGGRYRGENQDKKKKKDQNKQ